jgi:hypothetical protein
LSLNALLTVIDNIEIENTLNRTMSESSLNMRGFIKPPSSGFSVAQALKYTTVENKSKICCLLLINTKKHEFYC